MHLNLLSEKLLTKKTGPEELLSLLLKNRSIAADGLPDFLHPSHPKDYKFLYPELNTFKRYFDRFDKSKNILIYGDYDVDGITSTAILWQTLYKLGYQVTPFIPDREVDGYGFRAASFGRVQKEKEIAFDLLVTVDNGIVAHKEFAQIKETQNIDIIVIDHHLPSDPDSLNSIVTHLIHSTQVCGAALSWLAASVLDQNADLGLAALGTVADCMPLTGFNRSLVVHGLKILRLDPCPGIKKLLEISNVKPDDLSAFHLGYIIGPRINAVGRLSNPMDALRLLCAPSAATAGKYAKILDEYNRGRQSLQSDHFKTAQNLVEDQLKSDKLLFVADKSFHPGIIGLISGRLTEKYYLPSVAVSLNGPIAKGSCRSIRELNIIDTLRQLSKLFIDLGGHAGAAGFSIEAKNIPKLKTQLTKIVNQALSGLDLKPSLDIDAPMALSAVTVKNAKTIQTLEPFGIGNSEPLFLFRRVNIRQKRQVGSDGAHLSLKLDDPVTKTIENTSTSAICFKKGHLDSDLKVGDMVDIVASLSLNTFNGVTTPQLLVKEIIL